MVPGRGKAARPLGAAPPRHDLTTRCRRRSILPRNSNPYVPWLRAMTSATQSAASLTRAGELAVAAATVIGRRSWLGLEGAADPVNADYAELARLGPEKVEAFSLAGAAV